MSDTLSHRLQRVGQEIGDVALVVIDPISSYLGTTDSQKNSEVRGVVEPLAAMAERTGLAVPSVTHFSKVGAEDEASNAGLAWRTVTRAKARLKIDSKRDGFGPGATV